MTSYEATFTVENWDEKPYDEIDADRKLTQAAVTMKYAGGIEGTAAVQWLMAYAADGTATVVGIERITGTIDGREGSVVIQHVGGYSDGAARAELTVVAGSGTGALTGVTGTGTFLADPNGKVTLDLTFDE
jgi:predicted transcriptional regulator